MRASRRRAANPPNRYLRRREVLLKGAGGWESLSAAKQLRRLPAACVTLLAQLGRACCDFPRAMLMFICDLCPD